MAVIPAVKWIEVQVLVNNIPLEEYNPDDDELELKRDDHDRLISRYIEAKTDAEFKVQAKIVKTGQRLPGGVGLSFIVDIDGGFEEGRVPRRSEFRKGHDLDITGYCYYANGAAHEKSFKFSQLNIGK